MAETTTLPVRECWAEHRTVCQALDVAEKLELTAFCRELEAFATTFTFFEGESDEVLEVPAACATFVAIVQASHGMMI